MAITIHKNFGPIREHGKFQWKVVLDDGSLKKITILSDQPNDKSIAEAAILSRGQELFDKGKVWEDFIPAGGPAKTFLDNLPDLQAALTSVDNISSLADAKPILKKMVKAIYALNEGVF